MMHMIIKYTSQDFTDDARLILICQSVRILSDSSNKPTGGCLACCNAEISSVILVPDYRVHEPVSARLALYRASAE